MATRKTISEPKRKAVSTKKKAPPAAKSHKPDALAEAKRTFAIEEFRPGQKEAVETLLQGRDCLAVMPTGSGKSAIYQIAGMLGDGFTLVVSPLIALQKDQIDSINGRGGPCAVAINSTMRVAETRETWEQIEHDQCKYIFLAPEQFHRAETMDVLRKSKIALFAIDEAHCISEWGHDFRPDYLHLGAVVEQLNHPPVLAMTATASKRVRDEIVERLAMRSPNVMVHGFDRPNIHLRVDHFEKESEKHEALVHRVRWAEKPGIVYVGTRKHAETIMQALADEGVDALFYHGGLKADERRTIQDKFMGGDAEVIVATNAFGMGIDKADVRFVYHYDVSDSLDAYYQEIGRAGRDGEKAEAILFFRCEDIGASKFRSGEATLSVDEIERVAAAIADQEGPVQPEEIADYVHLPERKLTKAINRLEDVGAVQELPSGALEFDDKADLDESAKEAAEEQEHRKEQKREQIAQMEEYAETSSCRRQHLLAYFGDAMEQPCGNCDNCEASLVNDDRDLQVDTNVGTRREVA